MPLDYLVELGDDDLQALDATPEDALQFLDGLLQFFQLIRDLLYIHLGELVEASLCDCLGLLLREVETLHLGVFLLTPEILLELLSGVGIPTDLDNLGHSLLSLHQAL